MFGGFKNDELDKLMDEAVSLDRMTTLRKGFFVEFHGRQKTGKTLNALSASSLKRQNPNLSPDLKLLLDNDIIPEGAPVFVLDTELKAAKLKFKFKSQAKDIVIFPLFYTDPLHPMHIDPVKSLKEMAKIITAIHQKYDHGTLVIDSITDVTNWVRKYIQYELVRKKAAGHELGELIPLQPSDWQVRDDIWEYILKTLQQMKMHIIITSREKEDWSFEKDDETGKYKAQQTNNWSPRRFKDIPYYIDAEIALRFQYDTTGNIIGRVGTIASNQYDDESLNNLMIVNPTFVKLVEKLAPIKYVSELAVLKSQAQPT